MKITVTQPAYYAGEKPNQVTVDFIKSEIEGLEKNELIVFPEYANASGLTEKEAIFSAMEESKGLLDYVSQKAKSKSAYIAINVIEKRNGELKNSTYLFNTKGEVAFIYDKAHLPKAELRMGVVSGKGSCCCEIDNIRFAFMTCYDVYFQEQIEYIADYKPDIILVCSYQRGEREDILRAQAKLIAFRCNAYVARSSYSMNSDEYGGCAMIVAPDGKVLQDMGSKVGVISQNVDVAWKYMRSAGFGEGLIRNDDFISSGRKFFF